MRDNKGALQEILMRVLVYMQILRKIIWFFFYREDKLDYAFWNASLSVKWGNVKYLRILIFFYSY